VRANERNLLIGIAGLVLIAAFYFLILAPKRSDATKLDSQIGDLKTKIADENTQIEFAHQAKAQFASNYQHVVALGKAAPESADSASFLVQLNSLAQKSSVDFQSINLDDSGGAAAAPAAAQPGLNNAPPASSQPSTGDTSTSGSTTTGSTTTSTGSTASTTSAAAPATPTEASASTLPIGGSVGPAGLSVLKYKLGFAGTFFQIADFMASVDRLVSSQNNRVVVEGRLSTVDGFSLTADETKGFPHLVASLAVTTYVTPPGQGLTGGASPSAPSATIPGQAPQLASSGTGSTP
jgi:hypothetical protein